MSTKNIINKNFAGREGVTMISISPLGPSFSEIEWKKWLNYMPKFEQERIDYLKNKRANELTNNEIEELKEYKKELKMAFLSHKYGKEKLDKQDTLEYIDYVSQNTLNNLIKRKLTKEEYEEAKEKANKIIEKVSFENLIKYIKEQKKKFAELSMVDTFILREVSREANFESMINMEKELSFLIRQNENMRRRSLERK